ncbi:MAG: glycoside hydrolase family 9 protein, partial [Oscillospiraceae bacterium]|nr:glycoside hydrolase family 9 protein [Oscillospiraceae bacterium]
DANMCGSDVTNSSDLTWRNNCHTDDAVRGGYHDAGDHVMFGLPQGYTASTLGWSYYENKDIYDGLGQTEHYQKIMKRFCDFFVASTTLNSNNNVTKFLYQKGNGGIDHSYWGSPESQTQTQRGGLLYTTDSASDIAAEYAAALAQYAINFPNDSNKETYLNCAKALYKYSVTKNKNENVSEYTSTSYKDDQAWAAAWLYLATNEETYKNECQNLLNTFTAIADKRGYFWGDVELGAMVVYKRFIDPAYDWSIATNYLSSKCQGDSFVVLDEWGTARHNTALQMVALSASKVDGVNYTDWCKKQMNFILGDNSISSNGNSSTCFVVGFANNSAKYPHHRGASGYTNSSEKDNSRYSDNGHELVGALVGGPTSSGQYSDILDGEMAWKTNEVALDYNATLVGAAAALFDKYGTGTLVTYVSQIGTKNEVKNVYLQPNPVLTVYGKSTMYKGKTQILSYANKKGTVTWSIKAETDSSGNSVIPDCITVNSTTGLVTAVKNGTATIIATDDNNTTDTSDDIMAEFTITVTLSAITPDIPEGAELVDTITLSSSKSWQETRSNLPITDGQGNTYYYYIAEVDDRGEIISNKVSGYIPVEYDNGKSLSETGNNELSVTNKKSDVDEGSMPSTGGTGTQPYKVIGMVMAGGALIMLGIRRRKKHC